MCTASLARLRFESTVLIHVSMLHMLVYYSCVRTNIPHAVYVSYRNANDYGSRMVVPWGQRNLRVWPDEWIGVGVFLFNIETYF